MSLRDPEPAGEVPGEAWVRQNQEYQTRTRRRGLSFARRVDALGRRLRSALLRLRPATRGANEAPFTSSAGSDARPAKGFGTGSGAESAVLRRP